MCDHSMWGHDPGPPPPGTVTFVIGVRIDADRLRRIVQRTAPTLRECAATLDVPESVLSAWYAGRSLPQPATLHRILTQLRVDLSEVLPDGTPATLEVLRWRAGMTRQDVARAARMSRPRYAALEEGRMPTTDRDLAVLATALHVTEDEVHAAARRYPEVFWGMFVPTDLAGRIDAARESGESRNDAALRLWEDGLAARQARQRSQQRAEQSPEVSSPGVLLGMREILWRWDPLGLTDERDAGAPIDDEYDDLTGPLLTLLRAGAGRDLITGYLRRVMVEDYGLIAHADPGLNSDPDSDSGSDPGLGATVDRLLEWWPHRHETAAS
jgi:transcriptional regulator with XRE-family HTH domain